MKIYAEIRTDKSGETFAATIDCFIDEVILNLLEDEKKISFIAKSFEPYIEAAIRNIKEYENSMDY